MLAVKIETDGSIRLPKAVLRCFPKKSELVVWAEGDAIVLKRLRPLEPTEFAERRPGRECRLRKSTPRSRHTANRSAPARAEPPLVLDLKRYKRIAILTPTRALAKLPLRRSPGVTHRAEP